MFSVLWLRHVASCHSIENGQLACAFEHFYAMSQEMAVRQVHVPFSWVLVWYHLATSLNRHPDPAQSVPKGQKGQELVQIKLQRNSKLEKTPQTLEFDQ